MAKRNPIKKKTVERPVAPSQLLGDPVTADYQPQNWLPWFMMQRQRPLFTPLIHVPLMLPDARIQFGLRIIKGTIAALAKPTVITEPEYQEYANQQLERFMFVGMERALRCIDYGWAANEVLYTLNDQGQVAFDCLKDLRSEDCRAMTYKSNFVGCTVKHNNAFSSGYAGRKLFLGGPKVLWTVNRRDINPYYGQSHLYGAFLPWWEKWSEGGFRDMRRLWYYKNSFRSPTVRHPEGATKMTDGSQKSNKDIAREIGEWIRSGFSITLPSTRDAQGQYLWDIEDAKANDVPGGLLEYGSDLNLEIFEGMGIPEEVVVSQTQGFGSSSGRSIPMTVFLSTVQDMAKWCLYDFSTQVLKVLLFILANREVACEIELPSMADAFMPFEEEQPQEFDEDGNPVEPELEEELPPGKDGKKKGKQPPQKNKKEELPA